MKDQKVVDTPVLTLALKMHFTSCSPDALPISIALMSQPQFESLSIPREDTWVTEPAIFYGQFNNFGDIPYDDFVRDTVVPRLLNDTEMQMRNTPEITTFVTGNTMDIQTALVKWFKQFDDYKIEFVVDCGHLVWNEFIKLCADWKRISPNVFQSYKIGLPLLPANFSVIPIELNTVIQQQECMETSEEAFNEDRIEYVNKIIKVDTSNYAFYGQQHNALFDAFIIQTMYQWYAEPLGNH